MPVAHRRWTVADVRELMDDERAWPRYELIDGELIVTPSPNTPHQLMVAELLVLIKPYVDREQFGLTYSSPADLELRDGNITQPDVFVVPAAPIVGERVGGWPAVKRLALAIEIISPSSVRTDRITKRDYYMESGVAEYWVVDMEARMVERWTPDRDTPRVERANLVWHPANASTALTIALPALFASVHDKSRWVAG